MFAKLCSTAAGVVVAAIGLGALSTALADEAKRIVVVERATTDTITDLGAKGDSSGDILTFANDIYDESNTNKIGSDNGYEYKLYGSFSGETVYEPASNGFYPEFVLKNFEVISTNPPPIFRSQMSGRADAAQTRYVIEKPEPQF